ncbi:MAG: hypothetical protein PHN19_05865 [Patescibacteria group bacterium]|nr:hypothetical protein [Patescibacteria group bacterium]
MDFEVIKKHKDIILIYRNKEIDFSNLSNELGAYILTPEKFYCPCENSLKIFNDNRYDNNITLKLMECYLLNKDTKTVNSKTAVIGKYDYMLSQTGIINENKKFTKKGKLLWSIMKEKLEGLIIDL